METSYLNGHPARLGHVYEWNVGMKRFLYQFLCSWTAILTVTAFYLAAQLFPEFDRTGAAMQMATHAAFWALLVSQLSHLLYTKWIRPKGYVLVRQDALDYLIDMTEEYQDRVAEEDGDGLFRG